MNAQSELSRASLRQLGAGDFQLDSVSFDTDTLKIRASSEFLFYPFGRFHNISSLTKSISKPKLVRLAKRSLESNLPMEADVSIVLVILAGDTVGVFEDDERNRVEIAKGLIVNQSFELKKGIKVGMKKKDFLLRIFRTIPHFDIKGIKVVELISTLDGMWHYYTFSNNILKSIEFKTDCLVTY